VIITIGSPRRRFSARRGSVIASRSTAGPASVFGVLDII